MTVSVAYKNSFTTLKAVLSSMFWRAGAMFAVSLALIVYGAVVLVMICLFRLSDLSEQWDGGALGQPLDLRGQMGQTMSRNLLLSPNVNSLRSSHACLYGSPLSSGRLSAWSIPQSSHTSDVQSGSMSGCYSSVQEISDQDKSDSDDGDLDACCITNQIGKP